MSRPRGQFDEQKEKLFTLLCEETIYRKTCSKTNKELAGYLGVSDRQVKSYLKALKEEQRITLQYLDPKRFPGRVIQKRWIRPTVNPKTDISASEIDHELARVKAIEEASELMTLEALEENVDILGEIQSIMGEKHGS